MGRIEVIIGPMYSGKSSELIRLIRRYKTIGKNILTINHKSDNRYGNDIICTHDAERIACLSLDKLSDSHKEKIYPDLDIIIIEEAQFFSDLYEFVVTSANRDNKTIIVAGLDGDYKQQLFGDILRLIPHAEKVVKLHALCKECGDGTPASFTKRITSDKEQTLVGGTQHYRAVCRYHMNND